MGGQHQFGKLAYVRGQVWYTLSPYEQKPFAGIIKKGLPNMIRRFLQEAPYIAPPALAAYGIYAWATSESERLHRKGAGGHH